MRDRRPTSICRFAISILMASFAMVSTGKADGNLSANPLDQVDQRLTQIHSDLDTLRRYMGRPKDPLTTLRVRDVEARQIYFQSLVMYRISQRFAFDHTRIRTVKGPSPEFTGDYSTIIDLVNLTHERLQAVKSLYGIESTGLTLDRSVEGSEIHVFQSVVLAIHKLNGLLDQRISPSDVFEQVTVGIGYTSRILEQTQHGQVMPPAPSFTPNHLPADVYRRLLDCLATLQRIGHRSGLPVLELETEVPQVRNVEPGDVLNLASLVVSEIAYLHSQLPDAQPPREVYSVGRKFPAHVYQRVGILELQLTQLEQHTRLNPDWLGTAGETPSVAATNP